MRPRILLLCASSMAASCGDPGPDTPGPGAAIDALKTVPSDPCALPEGGS